jgi:hypothetical protein
MVLWPVTATARLEHGAPRAVTAAVGGTVYGGVTSQDFPVVIQTNRNGRKVTDATIAIRANCTSGGFVVVPDGYREMSVSKKRKFSASFGPTTERNDDGTTTDFEGTISGSFNKARTTASGRWSFKATQHDAAGAVADTCDSGSIRWTARQ